MSILTTAGVGQQAPVDKASRLIPLHLSGRCLELVPAAVSSGTHSPLCPGRWAFQSSPQRVWISRYVSAIRRHAAVQEEAFWAVVSA